MYKSKYLKYKNKYINAKLQLGGDFLQNPYSLPNINYFMNCDNNMYCKNINNEIAFNDNEFKEIQKFLYFVFPHCVNETNKKNVVQNIEFVGAGAYGIVAVYNNIAIKIEKNNKQHENIVFLLDFFLQQRFSEIFK